MKVWFWLVHKFTENYCHLRLFSKFSWTQKSYPTSLWHMYPNLKTICHIKLKYFLWAKLLKNLLLAKYLIPVTAPLNASKSISFCNERNQYFHIINSISHHTKPLSVGKFDCSCNVSKPVICKSLQVRPLHVSKSMSSCNVRNRNVHITNSICHDTKTFNAGKFDCFCNARKPSNDDTREWEWF